MRAPSLLALFAALTFVLMGQDVRAYTYQYGSSWSCNSNPAAITGWRQLPGKCADGNTTSLMFGSTRGDQTADAFWGWAGLGIPAQVQLVRGFCTSASWSSASDGLNMAWLPTSFFQAGQTFPTIQCNVGTGWDPDIYEIDIAARNSFPNFWRHDRPVNAGPGQIEDPTNGPCGVATISVEGTWAHELGHAYGLDHFDSWLSTMNTQGIDFLACRAGVGFVAPSSDAQQAIRNHPFYGLPAAVDMSAYNVVHDSIAGCPNVANPSCKLVPAAWGVGASDYRSVSSFDAPVDATVRFSVSNNRNALTQSTFNVALFLSKNEVRDPSDLRLATWTVFGGTFAGAIYSYSLPQTVTYSQLPTGRSCIIVAVDPDNQIAEFDENDNVAITRTCFERN